MPTQCSFPKIELEGFGSRKIEADFSGGQISSDGGGLLLREVDRRLRLTERLYEDLNDHESLSRDPLLTTLVGKQDLVGDRRRHKKHKGLPLASASTLGRIERTKADASRESRYEKVVFDFEAAGDVLVDVFVESFDEPPVCLVLDLDPSDIQLHGHQEQRFLHGYYDHYCYLPMYLFCGEYPLALKLRPANIDGALGAVEMLAPVVKKQQLDLFGARASCHTFRGNEFARAPASTLRVKLFKIGAQVVVSVRRVYIQLSTAYPLKELFAAVVERLRAPPAREDRLFRSPVEVVTDAG